MKPNGRRAWRQAGKRFRRKQRKFGYNPSLTVGVYTKRHWTDAPGHNGLCGGQFPPKAQPNSFTARCLVGMSEGAKKRLRRTTSKLLDRMHSNLASLGHQHDADRNDSFLRIGERLRPCPGCFHCQPGVKGWHLDRSRSGRFNMPTLALHCEGSGVLPARKQK